MAFYVTKSATDQQMAKFWDRVDKTGGPDSCWPWKMSKCVDGYGKWAMYVDGKQHHLRAHMVALQFSGSDRSDAAPYSLHSCDNPPCCNPAHLRWGTHAQNVQDAIDRGRVLMGEDKIESVLTDAVVRLIRHAPGTREEVARILGISERLVKYVRSDGGWKHVV